MFSNTLNKILCNRLWRLCFSFKQRRCYISGDSLWCCLAYKGVKPNTSYIDDIWLSQKEYLQNLSYNNI